MIYLSVTGKKYQEINPNFYGKYLKVQDSKGMSVLIKII